MSLLDTLQFILTIVSLLDTLQFILTIVSLLDTLQFILTIVSLLGYSTVYTYNSVIVRILYSLYL